MKRRKTFLRLLWTGIFIAAFSIGGKAQYIDPYSNPSAIIPSGEAQEFSIILAPGNYAESYLMIYAPSDWTITGSNPAGVISQDSTRTKISFTGFTENKDISVFMKPGCDIAEEDQVRYEFYSNDDVLLITGYSPPISNIKYPVFVFTAPADTVIQASMEAYREWTIQQNEEMGYLMGGDLTMHVASEEGQYMNSNNYASIRILSVEMLTNTGWIELEAEIATDRLSYQYTFTSADLKRAGNGDTILSSTETLRIREKIRYEYCYMYAPTIQPKLIYTPTHRCTKVKINTGESYVNFADPFPSSLITYTSYTMPNGPDVPGKFIIRITNPNRVTAKNMYHMLYTASTTALHIKVKDVYFSNGSGTRDASAPPVSYSYFDTNDYQVRIDYTATTPYKGFYAADEDGYCNDLAPTSEYIYLTVEWNYDFTYSGNCMEGTNNFLYNFHIQRYTYYSRPGCTYLHSASNPIYGENLGFNGWLSSLGTPNLIYYPETGSGTQTTLKISESPAGLGYPNGTQLKSRSNVSNLVELVLPSNLNYVPVHGVMINNVPVAASDITYHASTNTLTFYNRNYLSMTSDITYTFTIEAASASNSVNKNVKISHIFNWGNESYIYGCSSVPLTYIVRVPTECDYIIANGYRTERTTLGFKSKNFDAFSSLQEAREAGANLDVAGPYDNVEFEINAYVAGDDVKNDDGQPLYADIFYMNSQEASRPYFSKGQGAILQYQKPEEAWSREITIATDDIELFYENGTHHLRTDITPYLLADGVSLIKNTKLKVTFLSQATEYLPPQQTAVQLLQLGIYREGREVWDCNERSDNFFVWDYRLTPASQGNNASTPSDLVFWQNGQTGYKTGVILNLSMNNGISGLTEEIFPNEFRPNGVVNSFTWNGGSPYCRTVLIDRVYDSEGREFYEGTDYTISYSTGGTVLTFNEINAYTGEYYNGRDDLSKGEKGQQSYYIFADMRSVCNQDATGYNFNQALKITDFPTSENPVTYTPLSIFIYVHASGELWDISTSTTSSLSTTTDGTYSWPLKLTNTSVWSRTSNPAGADYKLPYPYLFVEVNDGEVDEFELYRIIEGQEVKINAPFEEYAGRPGLKSYWIKIGEITGEYASATSSTADFMLKANQRDCKISSSVNLRAEFGINTVTYPTDPYHGFTQYNTSCCKEFYPTATTLSGSFYAMDFSGTVDESEGMGSDGKFQLCQPAPMSVKFQNNLYGPATNLQIRIAKNTATSLILEDPSIRASYTQGSAVYPYDDTWEIDNSQEEYILIKLPASVVLAPKDEEGDHIVVNFAVSPMCEFLFGLPIYMDVIGTSMCGVTERKNIATRNIRLSGYDENDNPLSRLGSFSVTKIKDNSTGPVYSYLEEEDGIFKIKGEFVYQTTRPQVDGQATIKIPANIELLPGGVNLFERVGGGNTGSFTYVRGVYRAEFNNTEDDPTIYKFELDVRLKNPQEWSCEPYNIEINSVVTIDMYCDPADPEPCKIDYSTLSYIYSFTLDQYELDIISDKVKFTEYYDQEANAGRLKINASIANTSLYDMEGAAFYLYKDTNRNGIYDQEDTRLLSSPLFTLDILAGDEVDVETILEMLSADETCNLMLVMPCHSGVNRFLCDSAFVKKEVGYELATDNYRICQGTEITVGDPPIGNYSYQWSTEGAGEFSDATIAQPDYIYPHMERVDGLLKNQVLKLTLDRDPDGTNNCTPEEIYVYVYIEPKKTEWLGTSSSNWEDTDNWSNGVPGKCTYVTIPEQVDNYPVLTYDLTHENAARCDTIEFRHGGEVAKTYLLDYNAAKINLTLDPERWTMISSPLRYMHTGDYYVNGYNPNAEKWGRTPDVYWMYYRMANPENEQYYNADYYWSMPFNILEEPMQTGKGLVVWPDLETHMGTESPSGLMPPEDNKARFTFPRKENDYYYYYGPDENNNITPQTGEIARHPHTGKIWQVDLDRKHVSDSDSIRSRFTYEGLSSYHSSTGNFKIETYVNDVLAPTALVGNPFMSHLDLYTFQQANASMITSDFYIWSNNNSGGFFEAVKLLDGMDHLSTLAGHATVPPMQSFVVVKQPDPVTFGSLAITPAMSVTTPESKLRSKPAGENLHIALYNLGSRESAVTILFREGMSNTYHKEKDQYTLFPSEKTSMVLYALAKEDGEKRAVSIHTIGDTNQPIPLAIRTSKKGNLLTLKFTGLEGWAGEVSPYLEDREKGTLQNMRRYPEYTFTNFIGNIEEGRFYLRLLPKVLSVDEINEEKDFYIYSDKCRINMYSEGDPFKEVRIYNLQGQPLEYVNRINEEILSFALKDCREQILIVRMKTAKKIITKKLFIKP
ncbi:MAG: hypothetical protein LUG18_09850 [Candidatus Azobacteroides sp.]|nr:hypothetical protein [Candidatus Azobacteroides sp.]